MLVNALVKGALRKLGALATGSDVPAAEAADALEALQQMYLEMVGAGTFGRQADIFVPIGAPDFTAREARRYTVKDFADIAITLPELVDDSWWRCSWAPAPFGSMWIPPTVTTEPYTTQRPPLDGALITEADLSSTETRTFVYDSAIARWTSLQDLTYSSVAPLSTRYGNGLMCELAIRLAPEYDMDPPITVIRGASEGRSAMINRFDGPERVAYGRYF